VTTPGGVQEVVIINESGLYSLILRSRRPEAKAFKKWVTSEVIPSIRRTGAYVVPTATPAPMAPPAPDWMAPFMAALAQNLTVLTGKTTEVESLAAGAVTQARQAVEATSRQAQEMERIKAELADRDIDRRQLLHSELERIRDQVAKALCDRVPGSTFKDNCQKFWRHIKPRAGIGSKVTVHTMTVSGYERLHVEAKRYARELAVPLLLRTSLFDQAPAPGAQAG
jgi:prophage antirepressor-like protein